MMRFFFAFLLCLVAACAPEPYFESVLELSDTYDPIGPYPVETYVTAPRNVERLTLRVTFQAGGEVFDDIPFALEAGDRHRGRWLAAIPGRPVGAIVEYYLAMQDAVQKEAGEASFYPAGAPDSRLTFEILALPDGS